MKRLYWPLPANPDLVNESRNIIAYVTDIEGNWDYWNRYVLISRVLERNPEDINDLILKDNCELVFGGDVCDRGPGDLRVIDALNKLKEKYPSRVHFILGNRDVNKLRFPFELEDSRLHTAPKVFWLEDDELITPPSANENKVERLRWVRFIFPS